MTSTWVPTEFLKEIPKTDLHVHLDGSLRLSTLIELAQKDGITLPSYDEAELRKTVFRETYKDLPEYLEGFQYTVAVMRSPENIERISFEFAEDNYNEGVRYFEVRFAPQLFASISAESHLNIRNTIAAVNRGLLRARNQFNQVRQERLNAAGNAEENPADPFYDYGIIVCAMRSFPPAPYYDAFMAIHEDLEIERCYGLASETLVYTAIKCRDEDGIPVVALDVAGPEDGFPNKAHERAFDIAHEKFMNKTVHAGEGFGPESIFQAINSLHAERIGHGFHLFSEDKVSGITDEAERRDFVRKLVKVVCDRRMALEVCLTSNLGTMPGLQLKDHAMAKMVEHSVCLTICTDNRLVSDTTVWEELLKATDTFNLTPKQLREIVINGFKRSFFAGPYATKRKYIRAAMDLYDNLVKKYNIEQLYKEWAAQNNIASSSPYNNRARQDSVLSETDT
jgi:adenosine deaminase